MVVSIKLQNDMKMKLYECFVRKKFVYDKFKRKALKMYKKY